MHEEYQHYLETKQQLTAEELKNTHCASTTEKSFFEQSGTIPFTQFETITAAAASEATYIEMPLAEQVATQNVAFHLAITAGVPLITFYSTKEIAQYQPVGFDYGRFYWQKKNNKPLYFNRDGSIYSSRFNGDGYRQENIGAS